MEITDILKMIENYKTKNKFSKDDIVSINLHPDCSGRFIFHKYGEEIYLDSFYDFEELKKLCQ